MVEKGERRTERNERQEARETTGGEIEDRVESRAGEDRCRRGGIHAFCCACH